MSRSVRISFLLHAGLLGLLLLFATRPLQFSDTPLRVQILEAPTPPAPPEAPTPKGEATAPEPRPPLPRPRPPAPPARGMLPTERFLPRALPAPDKPVTQAPPTAVAPPAPPPPPVAARPIPEVPAPPPKETPAAREPAREIGREAPPPGQGRGGLALGGPGTATPAPSLGGSSEARPARPSIRDQIASLGTGLTGEADAKHTISLDDRRPQYLDFLGRLKQRIQREWNYPEEAQSLGLVGELLVIFTVNKEGSLLNLRLVRSSGFPVLDNEALRAVRAAAPFDPIPPEMGTEAYNIRATFAYLGPGRTRRR